MGQVSWRRNSCLGYG